ncbi:hypothetical protein T484DRAFT_1988755, partial [Baffinella frigidus]
MFHEHTASPLSVSACAQPGCWAPRTPSHTSRRRVVVPTNASQSGRRPARTPNCTSRKHTAYPLNESACDQLGYRTLCWDPSNGAGSLGACLRVHSVAPAGDCDGATVVQAAEGCAGLGERGASRTHSDGRGGTTARRSTRDVRTITFTLNLALLTNRRATGGRKPRSAWCRALAGRTARRRGTDCAFASTRRSTRRWCLRPFPAMLTLTGQGAPRSGLRCLGSTR